MIPRHVGLSLEPAMSERAFLDRELGIDWRTVETQELHKNLQSSGPHLLIISDPALYGNVLSTAPRASVVVFLISDEDYTPARLALIEDSPSVKAVFRHYSIEPAAPVAIGTSMREFLSDCRRSDVRATTAIDLISRGRTTRKAMRKWQELTVPVITVPLGYTDAFERAYVQARDITPGASLFDSWQTPAGQRPTSIAFRGIAGQPQRQVMIDAARTDPHSRIEIIDATWSGSNPDAGRDYVQLLMSAQRALCPPGFVNTESFRRYEAVLCGALPISPPTALTHLGRLPSANWTSVPSAIADVQGRLQDIRRQLAEHLVQT